MSSVAKVFTAIYFFLVFGWIGYVYIFIPGPSAIVLWLLVLYTSICVHVGLIAKRKGRSPVTFSILSFFASPLIMGIILAVMKNEIAVDAQGLKKCPKCAEDIKKEAIICKFCNSEV